MAEPVPVPVPVATEEQGPWTQFQTPVAAQLPVTQTAPEDTGPWTQFQAPVYNEQSDEIPTPSPNAVALGEGTAAVSGLGKGAWDINKYRANDWKPVTDETPYGVQKYLNKNLKVGDSGIKVPRGSLSLEDLGKATGMDVRSMQEVQDAIEKIKAIPGQQVPIEEIIQGVPTITGYKTVGGRPATDLSPYIKVSELEKRAPALNDFLVKNYKPIEGIKKRVKAPAVLGVSAAEAQAAINRAKEGDTGRAALDVIGAIGAPVAASRFLPKKLRVLGGMAAAVAPMVEATAPEKKAAGGLMHLAGGGGKFGVAADIAQKAATLGKRAIGAFDPRFDKRVGEIPKLQNMVLHNEQYGPKTVPTVHLPDYEGHPFITSISDRSHGGANLLGINDIMFKRPVDQTGGKLYMYNHPGNVWAAGDVPADNIMRQANALKDFTGKDPLYLPWQMAPTGSDFSHMTGQTMLAYAESAMPKSEKKNLDKYMKDIIPDWKGIDHPDSLQQFLSSPAGVRGAAQDMMDKNFRDSGGIGIGQARLAIADPEQLIGKDGSVSHVGRIFAGQDPIRNTGNASYPSGIPGEGIGKIPEDFNIYQFLTNHSAKRGVVDPANPTRPDLRSIELYPSTGILDDKTLKNMGFKKGGLAHLALGGSALKKLLPLAEREGNLAKFLEPSAVKHRLYHGTTSDISAFDPKTATNKTGNVTSHFGTFLSDNPAEASRYAQQWGTTGGNVMPVHAQLQNPYMMPYKEMDKYAMGAWNRRMAEPGYDPKSVVKVGDMDAQRKAAEAYEKHTQAAIQDVLNRKQELIELGHDGIIAKIGGNREIIPFEPTQIKSATGNTGTYNPLDPDITKKRGGSI